MTDVNLQGLDADGNEKEYSLSDFKGQKIILYFYPKDNTSGCTQEACDFRDNINRLTSYATVIGVSPDSIKHMGIERSTFIIDKLGKIEKEWHKVKIKGHVDEVIEFIKDKINNIITKKRVIKEELG